MPFRFDRIYEGHIEGDWPQLPTEQSLCLKVGSLIMMVANDPQKRWVNGSTGYVAQTGLTPRLELDSGESHDVGPHTW